MEFDHSTLPVLQMDNTDISLAPDTVDSEILLSDDEDLNLSKKDLCGEKKKKTVLNKVIPC